MNFKPPYLCEVRSEKLGDLAAIVTILEFKKHTIQLVDEGAAFLADLFASAGECGSEWKLGVVVRDDDSTGRMSKPKLFDVASWVDESEFVDVVA